MPKVSFILPAYKRTFLHQAIASILAQTYKDFELIIVDDASPENLKEVVDEFKDERLSYHRNQENIGGKDLVAAWNHALEFANGEWCVLASDDDIYSNVFLQEMIELTIKYPTVDIFHCRTGSIDINGKIIAYGDCHAEYESCIEYLYFRGVKRYYQVAPDFMFRISKLKEINGFISFPVGYFSDDATWFSLAREHGICCSSKMLFFMRQSGLNITTSKKNIKDKVLASFSYLKWFNSFVNTIQIKNDFDLNFLDYTKKHQENTIISFVLSLFSEISFWESISIIKNISFPNKAIRNLCIKHKIKQLIYEIIHIITLNRL